MSFFSSLSLYISILAGYYPLFGLAIILMHILEQKLSIPSNKSYNIGSPLTIENLKQSESCKFGKSASNLKFKEPV
jgi:hypothetical protein